MRRCQNASRLTILCLLVMLAVSIGPALVGLGQAVGIDDLLDLPFREFVDASYGRLIRLDPDTIIGWELADAYGLEDTSNWTGISVEALQSRAQLAATILDHMSTFATSGRTLDERIAHESYVWFLEDFIAETAYPYWDYGIGVSSYGAYNVALEILLGMPLEDADDAESYIARLETIDRWLDQLIETYQAREADNVLPTEFGIEMALMDLDWMFPPESEGGCDPTSLAVYAHFAEEIGGSSIPASTRLTLLARAQEAIEDHLIPGFRRLRDYVATLSGRGTSVGVSDYAGSGDYYGFLLTHHVTKPITAQDVHAIGLREVARLQEAMRSYATEVLGWPGDLTMAELDARIVAENQPARQGSALLAEYQSYVDEVTPLLTDYFRTLPTADLVITVEPDGPPAFYREPPLDGSGPGEIVTSLASIVSYTTYDEPVLMHHEGVPGHHFQLALSRDLDLPDFQRDRMSDSYIRHPLFQAFTEGWALYSEHLAAEMGVYEDDPFARLCQMRLLMTRIARLVFDTGINAFGWTWDDAMTYVLEEAGQTLRSSRSLFFDAYPAQACSYDIAYLTILSLRQRAMDELGEAFDIRDFHDALLLHGAMPISTLEWVIEEWIEETLASS